MDILSYFPGLHLDTFWIRFDCILGLLLAVSHLGKFLNTLWTHFGCILNYSDYVLDLPDGSVSPVSILKVEVFPAPFTPSNPKHSPLLTPKFK